MKKKVFLKEASRLLEKDNKIQKQVENKEYESCVMCGAKTEIPVSLPIEYRIGYEIGVGQLCEICYVNIEGIKYNDAIVSQEMMKTLLDCCKEDK